MVLVSKKIYAVKEELTELNTKFHGKTLLADAFYKQLMLAGFSYAQCLLVAIFPDGSNTYCGQIIRQDGKVVEFDVDLDLDTSKLSVWKDVTDEFLEICEKNSKIKPWQKELVALNLFREKQKIQ